MKYAMIFLAVFPYFLGIGLLAKNLLLRFFPLMLPGSPGLMLLLGLYTAGYSTMIWNIFFPADPYFSLTLYGAGWISLWYWRRDLKEFASEIGWITLLFPVLAFFGMRTAFSSDSTAYHIPGIIWTKTEPLALGIVQLSDSLSFNSLTYANAAASQPPFLPLAAAFLVNAWIMTGFLSFFLHWALVNREAGMKSKIFVALTVLSLVPLTTYFGSNLGSPTMEISTTLLTVLSLYFLFVAIERPAQGKEWLGTLHLFALIALMVRLSTAPLFVLAPLGFLALAWRNRATLDWRYVSRMAALTAVLLFPWLVRGLLSSGCLAYPAYYTCPRFLPWDGYDVALKIARGSAVWVRAPGTNSYPAIANSWDWLHGWWPVFWAFGVVKFAAGLTLLSLPFLAFNRRRIVFSELGFFFLCLVGMLLFWFFFLPDARYAYGVFLSIGPVLFAFALFGIMPNRAIIFRGIALVVCLGLAAKTYAHTQSTAAPASYAEWPPIPDIAFEAKVTPPENIVVYKTASFHDNCWIRIPCFRALSPDLEVRKIWGRYMFTTKRISE